MDHELPGDGAEFVEEGQQKVVFLLIADRYERRSN